MAQTLTIPIRLGSTKTGLTISAQLKDAAGANVASTWTIVEIGGGNYLATSEDIPDGHRGCVRFTATGGVDVIAGIDLGLQGLVTSIQAKANLITSGGVNTRPLVLEEGSLLRLVRGDDYTADMASQPSWTDEGGNWEDLTGGTATLTIRNKATDEVELSTACVISDEGTETQTVTAVPITSLETSALTVGNRLTKFDVEATLAGGKRKTLVRGECNILEDQTRHDD